MKGWIEVVAELQVNVTIGVAEEETVTLIVVVVEVMSVARDHLSVVGILETEVLEVHEETSIHTCHPAAEEAADVITIEDLLHDPSHLNPPDQSHLPAHHNAAATVQQQDRLYLINAEELENHGPQIPVLALTEDVEVEVEVLIVAHDAADLIRHPPAQALAHHPVPALLHHASAEEEALNQPVPHHHLEEVVVDATLAPDPDHVLYPDLRPIVPKDVVPERVELRHLKALSLTMTLLIPTVTMTSVG